MRTHFIALAIALISHAAAAACDPAAHLGASPTTARHAHGVEIIKTATAAPRVAAPAALAEDLPVATAPARTVAAAAPPPGDKEDEGRGLEITLAALALMSGIVLRHYTSGPR